MAKSKPETDNSAPPAANAAGGERIYIPAETPVPASQPAKAKPRRPSTALQAAAAVERILDALPETERHRVLGWINHKYQTFLYMQAPKKPDSAHDPAEEARGARDQYRE
jgi:hypothetical protein